jgi:putative Holliday junction resolvase
MGRIASIDYGLKRIGIALSDQRRTIALPLTVVEGGKKAIQNIKAALPLKEVSLILVGLPLELNGKQGPMAALVTQFAKQLEEALQIPIHLVDERLSSKGAEVHLKEIALNGKQRREKIDMIAATLLLQTYLDQQHAR